MAQSSTGFFEDDEEDALPLASEDRASVNLRSPEFQLPADEPLAPEPVASFGTPMAGALAGFSAPDAAPEPEPLPALGTPDIPESASGPVGGGLPELPAPRLTGADSPEVTQALQSFGQPAAPLAAPKRGYERPWLEAQARNERETAHRDAGIHSYLRSKGVETEILPDGTHAIATNEDGSPRWKPSMSAPFQDPESGRWLVRSRDERGQMQDADLLSTKGLVHTDRQTGARYIIGPDKQPIDLGSPDPSVIRRNEVAAIKSDLYARENAASLRASELQASLEPARLLYRQLQGSAATESDNLGGRSRSVKQLENIRQNLAPAIESGTAGDEQKAQYQQALDGLERFGQDHPEYGQLRETIDSGKAEIDRLNAARRKDRDRRLMLAADPRTSAAVAALLPPTMASRGESPQPGDADPAEVAHDTAVAAVQQRTTQSKALPDVLRQLRASGLQTIGGKPIADVIALAVNPPARAAKPSVEAPAIADDSSDLWRGMKTSVKQIPQLGQGAAALLGASGEKLLGEGGVSSAVKNWGLKGVAAAQLGEKAAAKDTDALTTAWKRAKGGDIGALADWLQYSAGYLIGQFGETAAVSALGGLIGGAAGIESGPGAAITAGAGAAAGAVAKEAVKTGIRGAVERLVAKEALKLASEVTVNGAKLVGKELAEKAAESGVRKAAAKQIGRNTAMMANSLIQEGGSIYPEAVQQAAAEGRELNGMDMARIWGSTILAAKVDKWGDALGLDAALGKNLSKGGSLLGRVGKSALAIGGKEGAGEVAQTALERFGAGQSLADQEAADDYINSGAVGLLGGGVTGGAGAALSGRGNRAKVPPPDSAPPESPALDSPDNPASPLKEADIPKGETSPSPDDAASEPIRQAKSFATSLRAADSLASEMTAAADNNVEYAALDGEMRGHQDALHTAQKSAIQSVPEGVRGTIAQIAGSDAAANERHFTEQPDAAFAAADLGEQVRDAYVTPEASERLSRLSEQLGEHGGAAEFAANQSIGMAAAQDLLTIATGRGEVVPERLASLQAAGLVEVGEDGALMVTHDATPLLPRGLTARLINAHDQFRVKSVHGEMLRGAAAMVRNGQALLENALHGRAMKAREAKAAKPHMVRVEFEAKGKPGVTRLTVPAHSEEQAVASAIAKVQKGATKVTHAEVTTAERERAREKEQAKSPDPLTPNRATAAKLSDFTPAEQPFANLVHNEWKRNRQYLAALGITRVELVRNSGDRSGLAVTKDGALQLDPRQLKAQADEFSRRGVKARDWAREALQEEATHAIQFKAAEKAGVDWREHYAAIRNDPALPPEMLDAARESYEGFDDLAPHEQGAELERMVLQQRWTGTITEAIFKSIERILTYLRGLKIESELLKESIARAEAVRDAALKVAQQFQESREPGETLPSPDRSPSSETSSPTSEPAPDAPRSEPSERKRAPEARRQEANPSPEPGTPAREPQAKASPKFRFTPQERRDGGFADNPIISLLREDGILSREEAIRQWGKAKFAENVGEFEDAPDLPWSHREKLYKPTGQTPDEAAQKLVEAGLLPENGSVADMWRLVRQISERAVKGRDQQAARIKEERAREASLKSQARDFAADTAYKGKGETEVTAWDVNEGDHVRVGTETMKVVSVNAADGSFVLEDGQKYGVQEVEGHIFGKLARTPESLAASRARKDTGTGDLFADAEERQMRAAQVATPESKRLAVLKASLEKKEAEFDGRLSAHFDDVKSANGQPLNDKRNGGSTVSRWDRQNSALRTLKDSIEVTKAAIEREENTIAYVESVGVPPALREMVDSGELVQWRKHPNFFFVKGVENGRIVWDAEAGLIGHRYTSDVPKEQYPAFRDAFNKARRLVAAYVAPPPDSLAASRARRDNGGQRDFLTGTKEDPFNLAGETGVDWQRRADERERAIRDAEEAIALAERDQMTLFASKAQTETPEFKRWFGKSEVVSDRGEPLVVYHGTDAPSFEEFDRAKTTSGPSKFGFWFTNQSDFADMFGGRKEAVFLRLESPKVITLRKWNDIRDRHAKNTAWFEAWRDQVIAEGHDGLIVRGGTDQLGKITVKNPDVYAAFESAQIKHAERNSGAFDPNDGNMLHASRARKDTGTGDLFAQDQRISEYLDLQSKPGASTEKTARLRELARDFPGGPTALTNAAADLQTDRVKTKLRSVIASLEAKQARNPSEEGAALLAQSTARLKRLEEVPSALSASRATPKQKEADRLAKQRELRAGFEAERGQTATAPEPHVLTKPEGRSVINAYHHLAQKTGFPAVAIADLSEQSGVPLDKLKAQLLRSRAAGTVVLSTGDWSLSSPKDRSGMIEVNGEKMLQVRWVARDEALAASRANPVDERGIHYLAKPVPSRNLTPDERRRDPAYLLEELRGTDDRADSAQRRKHGRIIASHSDLTAQLGPRSGNVARDYSNAPSFGGGEHSIYVDPETKRVFKITKPGLFGAQAEDGGAYLQRWALSNRVLGDDVRIEGFTQLPGEQDVRAVISQPAIEGHDATTEEQRAELQRRGFREAKEGRWVHPVTGVAIWDTHTPGNAIATPDGRIVPIDWQVEPASREELKEVREASGIGGNTLFASKANADPDAARKEGYRAGKEDMRPKVEAAREKERERATAAKTALRAKSSARMDALKTRMSGMVSKVAAYKEVLRKAQAAGKAGVRHGIADARQALDAADRDMWAQMKLVTDSLVTEVNESLPPEHRGHFLSQIAGLSTDRPSLLRGDPDRIWRASYKLTGKILQYAEDVHRKALVEEIEKIRKRAVGSPSVAIDYIARLERELHQFSFVRLSAAKRAELESRRKFVEQQKALGNPLKIPQAEMDEMDRLHRPHISTLSTAALKELRNRVEGLEERGRQKWEGFEGGRQRRVAREKAEAVALKPGEFTEFNERPPLVAQPPEFSGEPGGLTVSQKLQNAMTATLNYNASLGRAIDPMNVFFDIADGGHGTYDGYNMRTFKGPVDLIHDQVAAAVHDTLTPLQGIIDKYKLTPGDFERIGTVLTARQEGGEGRQNATPERIKAIEANLSAGELAFIDAWCDIADTKGPEIAEIMRTEYNQEVKLVKRYFPLTRDHHAHRQEMRAKPLDAETGAPIKANEFGVWEMVRDDFNPNPTAQLEKGFTKERLPGAATAVKTNAWEVIQEHVNRLEFLKYGQSDMIRMKRVAGSAEYAGKFGAQTRDMLMKWIDVVARAGGVDGSNRIRGLDAIRKNTAKAIMAFRFFSQLQNLAALPFAFHHAGGFSQWLRGFNIGRSPDGQKFIANNLASILDRKTSEAAQHEIINSKFTEAGFSLARWLDRNVAQATAVGRYLNEMTKKGYSVESALVAPPKGPDAFEALRVARVRMQRAVSSAHHKDAPLAVSKGVGFGGNVSIAQSLFQFKGDSLNRLSNLTHDLWRAGVIKNRDPKAALLVTTAFLVSAGVSVALRHNARHLTNALTGFVPKREEEGLSEQFLMEILRSHPIMETGLQMAMNGKVGIATLDVPTQAAHELYMAPGAKTGEKKVQHAIRGVAGAIATTTGLPGSAYAGELLAKLIGNEEETQTHRIMRENKIKRTVEKPNGAPVRKDVVAAVRGGEQPQEAVKKAVAGGMTPLSARGAVREGLKSPEVAAFEKLPLPAAIEVYKRGLSDPKITPETRKAWHAILQRKHASARELKAA